MTFDATIRAACEATVGRERTNDDSIAPETAARLGTVLGRPLRGQTLPPTWHWAYFNRAIIAKDQGPDLHERTGLFLPAAPFSRRMWAAGDVTLHTPLKLDEPAHQQLRIAAVDFKEGRSGAMCFVTVEYHIEQAGRLCIDETRIIVYRDRGATETALRAPEDPVPDGFRTYSDGQLFFYSAITHNGHRIHWDRDYCRTVEGYPDLVVHGPLMATDLCDAIHDGAAPCRFSYRAQAPVFVTTPVKIKLGTVGDGRIVRSDGVTSMSATLMPL